MMPEVAANGQFSSPIDILVPFTTVLSRQRFTIDIPNNEGLSIQYVRNREVRCVARMRKSDHVARRLHRFSNRHQGVHRKTVERHA